jgi:hypothetical protein
MHISIIHFDYFVNGLEQKNMLAIACFFVLILKISPTEDS